MLQEYPNLSKTYININKCVLVGDFIYFTHTYKSNVCESRLNIIYFIYRVVNNNYHAKMNRASSLLKTITIQEDTAGFSTIGSRQRKVFLCNIYQYVNNETCIIVQFFVSENSLHHSFKFWHWLAGLLCMRRLYSEFSMIRMTWYFFQLSYSTK